MPYWNSVRNHYRVLGFGFVHAFCSAPGQTFCISLFVASFAAEFQTSAAQLGSIYLIATLGAAFALTQIGARIDRIGMRTYSVGATLLLTAACFSTAAAPNLVVLTGSLLALRLSGQGLMVHIQSTATARAFTENRGVALSLTGLGIPLAGIVFPTLAVLLITQTGWRWAYAIIGAGVFALLIASAVLFYPHTKELHPGGAKNDVGGQTIKAPRLVSTAGSISFQKRYFWAAVPTIIVVPFVSTALFFQLTVIAAGRGWTSSWVAAAFAVSAVSQVASLFVSGRLIDAYSARRVALFHAVPNTIAVVLMAAFDHPAVLLVAMFGIGLSGGAAQTAFTAVWAEIYGTSRLGAIRSRVMSLMVVASAAAPLMLGLGLSAAPSISIALAVLAAVAVVLQLPLLVFETMHAPASE